jgi:hypothetical protein
VWSGPQYSFPQSNLSTSPCTNNLHLNQQPHIISLSFRQLQSFSSAHHNLTISHFLTNKHCPRLSPCPTTQSPARIERNKNKNWGEELAKKCSSQTFCATQMENLFTFSNPLHFLHSNIYGRVDISKSCCCVCASAKSVDDIERSKTSSIRMWYSSRKSWLTHKDEEIDKVLTNGRKMGVVMKMVIWSFVMLCFKVVECFKTFNNHVEFSDWLLNVLGLPAPKCTN